MKTCAIVLFNIYLTKSGQNVDFWTFCDHNKDIGWSQRIAEILKIEKIYFIFYKK
jgi:hypothetical protein